MLLIGFRFVWSDLERDWNSTSELLCPTTFPFFYLRRAEIKCKVVKNCEIGFLKRKIWGTKPCLIFGRKKVDSRRKPSPNSRKFKLEPGKRRQRHVSFSPEDARSDFRDNLKPFRVSTANKAFPWRPNVAIDAEDKESAARSTIVEFSLQHR